LLQVHRPEAADPESSGALASCLWELTLLTQHFHPAVTRLAADVAALAASRDATGYLSVTPTEAVAAYSTVSGGFRPGIQAPRKKTGGKTGGGKRKPGLSESFKRLVQEDEVGVSGEGIDIESVGRSFRVLFRQVRDHRENVALRKEQRRVAAVKLKMKEREALQAKLRAKKERKLKSKLRDKEARTSGKEKRAVNGEEKVAEKRERIGEKVAEKRKKRVVDGKEKAAIKQKKRTG
jgi:nucleolar complex protein 3